ncbi:transposase [Perkinsela sp. CCAP 1560/4]|nr:transposase [Perkinsela sp. CCAP 1560/4]|eukprot:KNH06800.1 transposase [Perkinsela sp. CCAP 1560/4]
MKVPSFISNRIPYYRLVLWHERMQMPGAWRGYLERIALTAGVCGLIFAVKIGNPIKYYHMKTKGIEDLLYSPDYEKYRYTSAPPLTFQADAEEE